MKKFYKIEERIKGISLEEKYRIREEQSRAILENSIRPFVLGRKNWPFRTSVEGANTSAIFFQLLRQQNQMV